MLRKRFGKHDLGGVNTPIHERIHKAYSTADYLLDHTANRFYDHSMGHAEFSHFP